MLGTDREGLAKRPAMLTVINSNSPLRVDGPMSEGLTAFALAAQPFAATPFTLSGAMAPVTIGGALVQQNAEALAMITMAQCVRAGAPVIYGGFTSNVDMKTGAPAFGTPEYAHAVLIGCQLARRYGVPYGSSNVTSCNTVDAQAAYESAMSLWPACMGHAHIIKHAAGWLEGGLTASFEKFILDAEMLQMMAAFMTPPAIDEDAFGFDAMAEVGPGGHFFGTSHTLERYETPSIRRSCRIGGISKPGRSPAAPTRLSMPTASGNNCYQNTKSHQSMPQFRKKWTRLFPGERKKSDGPGPS